MTADDKELIGKMFELTTMVGRLQGENAALKEELAWLKDRVEKRMRPPGVEPGT